MARYRNNRSYTARVIAICEGRVLYNSFDADGTPLQVNGCVSERHFFANWRAV